jgi:DNA-directed RNA polymerase subunit RPC12/RpoP
MPLRLSYDYVRNIVEKAGCKLVSKEYKNTNERLLIKGVCGHEYLISFSNFYGKHRYKCPKCARAINGEKKRNKYEDIKQFVESKGCKLLSTEYKTCKDKLNILGRCGHPYIITIGDFRGKERYICGNCGRQAIADFHRLSYDYVKSYVESKGCILISENYIDSKAKLQIIGTCGHEYSVRFDNFKNTKNHICQKCSNRASFKGKKVYSYDEVYDYIKSRGCRLLSKTYKDNITKLHILFACGHGWL